MARADEGSDSVDARVLARPDETPQSHEVTLVLVKTAVQVRVQCVAEVTGAVVRVDRVDAVLLTPVQAEQTFVKHTLDATHVQRACNKSHRLGMSNLPSKLGQIGHKWDKSGTF